MRERGVSPSRRLWPTEKMKARRFSGWMRWICSRLMVAVAVCFPFLCMQLPQGHALRTGILVHGCHLQAEMWERIVWGDEEQQLLGRIPHAVLLAEREQAELVIFGTGGSQTPDGTKEGAFSLQYMLDHFARLANFAAFKDVDLERAERRMRACSLAEIKSLNTKQELENCGDLFNRARMDKVILVSSPTHIPRCLRDACSIWAQRNYKIRRFVMGSPSETCYHNSSVEDVQIVEPPHRGDRDKSLDEHPLHKLLGLYWKENKWRQRIILEGLHDLLGPEIRLDST